MSVEVKAVTDAKGAVTETKLLADAERVHRQLRPHRRFHFREGLTITSFHFAKKISSRPTGIKEP